MAYTLDTWTWVDGARIVFSPERCCRDIALFLRTNPDAWAKGCVARSGDGIPVPLNSPFARKWCALGLIERFAGTKQRAQQVVDLLNERLPPTVSPNAPIHRFNDADTTTFADILALFERGGFVAEWDMPAQRAPSIPEETSEDIDRTVDGHIEKLVPWESIMADLKMTGTAA